MGAAPAYPLLRLRALMENPLETSLRRCTHFRYRHSFVKISSRRRFLGFRVLAEENKKEGSVEDSPLSAGEEKTDEGATTSGGGEDQETGSESRPRGAAWKGIGWRELLLAPDPDNVVAVGLTGILALASLQVLWQILLISLAILVAALKYSFVAALLLFILITLL